MTMSTRMPAILRRLPFFAQETHVVAGDRRIKVRSDQIVVWISIAAESETTWRAGALRFPAILDTGCNHNLVIREDHLAVFAGISLRMLPQSRSLRIQGRRAVELRADLWLHRNRAGRRDEFADRQPYLLNTHEGIAVMEAVEGDDYPRLPLLGLRALRWANLHVWINCRSRHISISTGWLSGMLT